MTKKTIKFASPLIDSKEKKEVLKILNSGIYSQGVKCKKFEQNFKRLTKAKYATTVNSCTSGMHLFYFSIGLKKGDEVIVPAQTHVATAHAVELTGARPVFIDAEITTGNINIGAIESAITSKTRAIAIVHYLGVPVDMPKVMDIAKKYNLFVLEDCALAPGAKVNNLHVGLHGDAGSLRHAPRSPHRAQRPNAPNAWHDAAVTSSHRD
mgnify:CR=1 FL=1